MRFIASLEGNSPVGDIMMNDDLEVTHRVGKPSLPPGQIDQADEANQPASREVSAEAADTEPDDGNPVSTESRSRNATQDGQSQPQVPRPILVKFVSRRVKGDIMSSRKNLKGKKLEMRRVTCSQSLFKMI